jgi:hypothetical protein
MTKVEPVALCFEWRGMLRVTPVSCQLSGRCSICLHLFHFKMVVACVLRVRSLARSRVTSLQWALSLSSFYLPCHKIPVFSSHITSCLKSVSKCTTFVHKLTLNRITPTLRNVISYNTQQYNILHESSITKQEILRRTNSPTFPTYVLYLKYLKVI